MLSWQWPWLVYLLPLPLIIRFILPVRKASNDAIRVPFYTSLNSLSHAQQSSVLGTWLRGLIALLVWAALLAAAAHPRWIGDPVALPQEQRDLLLAVDISQSMEEQDMLVQNKYVARITAVKNVLGDFIERRAADRIGLILFGTKGYLQTPLTYDNPTVFTQLQEAQTRFAGRSTAIGDAIGLAIKNLRDRPAESRVLILLTDGANTSGTEPLQAADIAKQANIRIHTIGVGADSKLVKDFFGRTRNTNPSADLDEQTLQTIADKTGGQYFRARDPDELKKIYFELDRLEPAPEEQTFRPTRSLTFIPIIAAIALSLLLVLSTIARRFRQGFSISKNTIQEAEQ